MKTISIEAFTYGELSPKAQAKACDWYREASAGDEMDTDEEDKREIATRLGFQIDKIYWTGFSSQGDGACFTGTWRASDVQPGEVKAWAPVDEKLHKIAAEFERIAAAMKENKISASAKLSHRGRSYHEYSIELDLDFDSEDDAAGLSEKDAEKFEAELRDASQDLMRWMYRQLEAQYEYEQSDEHVAEEIVVNEYLFTAEGKRSVVLE